MAASAKQALSDLSQGKTWPVYFLYGDEPFKIHEFIDKAAATVFGPKGDTLQIERIDGAQATGHVVLEAVKTLGLFGSNRKFVVVRDAQHLKEQDALSAELMGSAGEPPWGDTVLILTSESLDGRRKFHQWLKKQGLALEFKRATEPELGQWVQYLAKKRGAVVADEAVPLLVIASEGSLYRLAQEIEKAWLFSSGARNGGGEKTEEAMVIRAEHVAAVSAQKLNHQMIELVTAILESKRTRALLLAEQLIQGPDDALGLVGFLTWALKNLGKSFAGSVAGGLARAQRLVEALMDLDLRLKSSGADTLSLVESFIVAETR